MRKKNNRETPYCPVSINTSDVSRRMVACLQVGRQRTASMTVEASSSLALADVMWGPSVPLSSLSKIVLETPRSEWLGAWWVGSEMAGFRLVWKVQPSNSVTTPFCSSNSLHRPGFQISGGGVPVTRWNSPPGNWIHGWSIVDNPAARFPSQTRSRPLPPWTCSGLSDSMRR